ncbi:hypothetical protein CCY99_00955 [Helicobacter sp. 16-1353]|uniref:MarR family winged helix-turn-helix transcriptional regulator n=1 Tax=Helicobacter sp. 16-1353 TaxID=2004996 RepID=UPI000DCCA7C8|nr:MarR family transcriptional regulator [Helicobacter sp. 16-1353]RAX55300.1 hypothetical protein CCY99_00955 [Helicobacter sp. 16-1353]
MNVSIYQCIGFLATGLRECVSKEFNKRIQHYGITYPHAGVLWICSESENSQIKLSSFIQVDKNHIRVIIDDMEQKGYLYRKRNPKNRKENLILLTEEGEKIAQETFQIMLETHADMLLPHISEDEMATLQNILYKVFVGLSQSSKLKIME